MVESAGGAGGAGEVEAVAVDGPILPDEEMAARIEEGRLRGVAAVYDDAARVVASAERAVEKAKAQLVAAQEALAAAKAAQKGLI